MGCRISIPEGIESIPRLAIGESQLPQLFLICIHIINYSSFTFWILIVTRGVIHLEQYAYILYIGTYSYSHSV